MKAAVLYVASVAVAGNVDGVSAERLSFLQLRQKKQHWPSFLHSKKQPKKTLMPGAALVARTCQDFDNKFLLQPPFEFVDWCPQAATEAGKAGSWRRRTRGTGALTQAQLRSAIQRVEAGDRYALVRLWHDVCCSKYTLPPPTPPPPARVTPPTPVAPKPKEVSPPTASGAGVTPLTPPASGATPPAPLVSGATSPHGPTQQPTLGKKWNDQNNGKRTTADSHGKTMTPNGDSSCQ
mmetsp:Transcript_23095/g.58381  ORF Transcript_23095/g.58381 Transcript_23095/m.58381 type:complete len:236 (-) Transcript_23095:227-934(-)